MRFTVGVLSASVAYAKLTVTVGDGCNCADLATEIGRLEGDITKYPEIVSKAQDCPATEGGNCVINLTGSVDVPDTMNCAAPAFGYSILGDALSGWTVGSIGWTGFNCAATSVIYVEKTTADFCTAPGETMAEFSAAETEITLKSGNPTGGLVAQTCEPEADATIKFTINLSMTVGSENADGSSTEESSVSEDGSVTMSSASADSGSSVTAGPTTTPGGATTGSPGAAEGLLAASLATSVIVVLGNL